MGDRAGEEDKPTLRSLNDRPSSQTVPRLVLKGDNREGLRQRLGSGPFTRSFTIPGKMWAFILLSRL